MQSKRSIIEDLPHELIQMIEAKLSPEDLKNCRATNVAWYNLFNPSFLVATLFSYLKNGNYAMVEKMIIVQPALMLQKMTHEGERISPLQYAFKVYDIAMINLFINIVNDKNKQTMTKIKLEFVNQLIDQKSFLEFDFLHNAYKAYNVAMLNLETSQELWLQIGKSQAALPHHLLLQFCHPGKSSWGSKVVFANSPIPNDLTVMQVNGQVKEKLNQAELGETFTLLRGDKEFALKQLGNWSTTEWNEDNFNADNIIDVSAFLIDAECFKKLCATRKAEFNAMRKLGLTIGVQMFDSKEMPLSPVIISPVLKFSLLLDQNQKDLMHCVKTADYMNAKKLLLKTQRSCSQKQK